MYGINLAAKVAGEKALVARKLRGFTNHKQIVARFSQAEEQGLDEIHPERTEIRNIISSIQDLRQNGINVSVY
jgi:hypothetical protein